jgi:hypothetical protein
MATRRVDWSFGPGHGPVSGVVNASLSALALTMVAELAGITPLWGLTGGIAIGTGAMIAALWQHAPGRVLAYRALCWVAAGGWSAWALWLPAGTLPGPWTRNALAVLVIGTAAAAFVGLGLQHAQRKDEQQHQQDVEAVMGDLHRAEQQRKHERVAAAWQAEIRRQTGKEVTVVGVEFWEPNTGFTLDLQLPRDGTTIDDLKRLETTLAAAMDVPPGCAVELIDPGISRQVVHIRVGTEDALAQDHHLPDDCEMNTIENDLSLGIKADRTDATVNVRYNNLVLVGQVDSGKSNELNVVTRQLARCTDCLVWAIDKTGNGRYPRPWVRAWKEDRTDAPAIDWVAPNDDEALLMTRAALAIIEGRTADYEQLMFEQGWDKIMVSPEIPQIVIITDEFGSLTGEVKDNLKEISDTGRGAGVRVISCALEATGQYIPRAMITQSRERVGMRVQDETQLQYLFDTTWRSGRFDMSSMRVRGSGVFSSDAAPPEKFKGWLINPARIDAESVTVGPWRPELDDASVRRADTLTVEVRTDMGKVQRRFTQVYTDRWERTLPLIFPAVGVGAKPRPAVREKSVSLGDALAALEAGKQRLQALGRDDLPPLPDSADFSVVESWLAPGTPAVDESGRRKPLPRARMRQLVWDSSTGIGPTAVHKILEAEGYGTTYPTVNGWMKADAAAGILDQAGDREPYTRGPKMTNPYED